MRRNEIPFKGRKYLLDTNPLSKLIHDLDHEKQSCNIHKIITPHIKMYDTKSQVYLYMLLHPDYKLCKCCMKASLSE
ncbi:hypothetical protein QBE52_10650 [Clostridiaceae bacterium 35-E11]